MYSKRTFKHLIWQFVINVYVCVWEYGGFVSFIIVVFCSLGRYLIYFIFIYLLKICYKLFHPIQSFSITVCRPLSFSLSASISIQLILCECEWGFLFCSCVRYFFCSQFIIHFTFEVFFNNFVLCHSSSSSFFIAVWLFILLR